MKRKREEYELLRLLLREENIARERKYRAAVVNTTTRSRPLQSPLLNGHGSASSTEPTGLSAKWKGPMLSADRVHPKRNYADLVEHNRKSWVHHVDDRKDATVGAGSGCKFVASSATNRIKN